MNKREYPKHKYDDFPIVKLVDSIHCDMSYWEIMSKVEYEELVKKDKKETHECKIMIDVDEKGKLSYIESVCEYISGNWGQIADAKFEGLTTTLTYIEEDEEDVIPVVIIDFDKKEFSCNSEDWLMESDHLVIELGFQAVGFPQ